MENQKFVELVLKTLRAQQVALEELSTPIVEEWGSRRHPAEESVEKAGNILSQLEQYEWECRPET